MDGFDGGKSIISQFSVRSSPKITFRLSRSLSRPVSGSLRTLAMDGWRQKNRAKMINYYNYSNSILCDF